MSEQLIFKRYEIKYKITKKQFARIKEAMKEHMIPDEHGKSTICSLYFDTPDHLLVRRSIQSPPYKEKLRLRSYGVATDDSQVFIEIKKKYDSIVYKRRVGMTYNEAYDYLYNDKQIMDTQITREIDYLRSLYTGIAPSILLTYDREAYYDKDDHEFRMTFDDHILYRTEHLELDKGIYGTPVLDDNYVLMEVKVAEAMPLWLVKVLSKNNIYKTSFSKFGTAYKMICESEKKKENGGIYQYA
ncbi:MAG: polyphosphate polymerase domain-containing protein [Lachnospiraceae bacterium]